MTFPEFKKLLEKRGPVTRDGGDWRGRCPAHNDDGQRGDLTFREADGKIVLHCWHGCDGKDVVEALGLKWSDLFSNNGYGKTIAKTTKQKTVYPTLAKAIEAIGQRLNAEYIQSWTYRKADGSDALLVARFHDPDGKRIDPSTP